MSAEEAQNAAAAAAEQDDEVPTLEEADVAQTGKAGRRYAKMMGKMGLKPEPNISKVAVRKVGSISFTVPQPEVYRFPGTNTFVILGEMSLEDSNSMAQDAAAQAAVAAAAGEAPSAGSQVEEVDDGEEEDAGDLADKEINMVMSQANVSRNKAIRALKKNNGDVVNAIMELTI